MEPALLLAADSGLINSDGGHGRYSSVHVFKKVAIYGEQKIVLVLS